MTSRVAKALLRHPACCVLLLFFGLMISLVGLHDSKRQKYQKTADVLTLAVTISALPYSLGCTPTSQEGSPIMMMKTLPYSLWLHSYFTGRQPYHNDESTSTRQWPLQ